MAVERLACGRELDDLWEGLDRAPDEHEQDCATCQAARDSMSMVQDATASMRLENESPEMTPSPRLAESIKSLARTQVRRDRTFVVIHDDDGEVTASEWAVVQSIRRVLDPLPELRVQRVRISTTERGLALTLRIVVALGLRAPEVADGVRSLTEQELRRQLRQAVDRVDVEVGDMREW